MGGQRRLSRRRFRSPFPALLRVPASRSRSWTRPVISRGREGPRRAPECARASWIRRLAASKSAAAQAPTDPSRSRQRGCQGVVRPEPDGRRTAATAAVDETPTRVREELLAVAAEGFVKAAPGRIREVSQDLPTRAVGQFSRGLEVRDPIGRDRRSGRASEGCNAPTATKMKNPRRADVAAAALHGTAPRRACPGILRATPPLSVTVAQPTPRES
jgi:hypothetical protein